MTSVTVLVVDDEAPMRRVLEIMLRQMGHEVLMAADGAQALALLAQQPVDLVLTDLRMPGIDGLGLLRAMAERGPRVPAIVMTAQGSVASAVQAMKLGAQDYLLRPFDVDILELSIERVLERQQLRLANDFLREQVARRDDDFHGTTPVMREVFDQIRRVGPSRASVFITGETGTGKELAARAVHRASDRAAGLFVAINCAAMPADMVEAELFGHEKGAFTGAVKERVGKFELASHGTIFLDEITEMPLALQAKLLRVLQEGRVERLGSNRVIELDLRVVAACNVDPREAVRTGRLREDLYYRLNVFSLRLPPLRERLDDLDGLVRLFAARAGRQAVLSDEARACLMRYPWPGNVRELENVVQRALILSPGPVIEPRHLPADLTAFQALPEADAPLSPPAALPSEAAGPGEAEADAEAGAGAGATAPVAGLPESLHLATAVEQLEARIIAEALRRTCDNKRRAAALLGISERTLWYKLGRARSGDAD